MSIWVCDNNDHGEICYQGHSCSACEKIESLKNEIEELEGIIADQKDEIAELEQEIEE